MDFEKYFGSRKIERSLQDVLHQIGNMFFVAYAGTCKYYQWKDFFHSQF